MRLKFASQHLILASVYGDLSTEICLQRSVVKRAEVIQTFQHREAVVGGMINDSLAPSIQRFPLLNTWIVGVLCERFS